MGRAPVASKIKGALASRGSPPYRFPSFSAFLPSGFAGSCWLASGCRWRPRGGGGTGASGSSSWPRACRAVWPLCAPVSRLSTATTVYVLTLPWRHELPLSQCLPIELKPRDFRAAAGRGAARRQNGGLVAVRHHRCALDRADKRPVVLVAVAAAAGGADCSASRSTGLTRAAHERGVARAAAPAGVARTDLPGSGPARPAPRAGLRRRPAPFRR